MNLSLDETENLLYNTLGNKTWLDLLAPQEIDRLVAIFQSVVVKEKNINVSNGYVLWARTVNQAIDSELKESEDLFGVTDLGHKLNMGEFLKKVYHLIERS